MLNIFKKDIWNEKRKSFEKLELRYEDKKSAVRYFCTPKGAEIFASLGVDGIHYCTIPKLGETVFAVTPMSLGDRHVFPVANSKMQFLQLVAALCGTFLIDQIPTLSKTGFEELLRDHLATDSADRADELEKLKKEFDLSPLELDPYELVMGLYNSFDYDKIEFTKDYYETLGI